MHPQYVERYYSNGLYPVIARGLRIFFGWLPFSVGDVIYLIVCFLAVRYIYLRWASLKKQPLRFVKNSVAVLSLVYFIFHSLWGINYYRQPITWKLGIAKEYTLDELIAFTEYLALQTNSYQLQLTGDSTAPVQMPYSRREILVKTKEGYAMLAKTQPDFAYKNPSLKTSLFSIPLTYMGYGGYMNPFSNEAQVNGTLPLLRLPVVSGHEVGHQLGYAAEDATNFIGFWVTLHHEDLYFKYSAYLNALRYSLSTLAVHDTKRSQDLTASLHPGVQQNMQEIRQFWKKHKNPLEPVFKSIFNIFLKASHQKEGIRSYGAVVGLLIRYHHTHGF